MNMPKKLSVQGMLSAVQGTLNSQTPCAVWGVQGVQGVQGSTRPRARPREHCFSRAHIYSPTRARRGNTLYTLYRPITTWVAAVQGTLYRPSGTLHTLHSAPGDRS